MTRLARALAPPYVPDTVSFEIGAERVSFDWGLPHELGSAAFWTERALRSLPADERSDFHLGATLAEEVTACLLGGHGIPSAVGLAAFGAVRAAVDLGSVAEAGAIEQVLRKPLVVEGRSRPVRYRFPRQRATRIAAALDALACGNPPTAARALRDWLVGLPGVGPKTASWIVRNFTGSNDVAIIDVHIRRAGLGIGCFLPYWTLPRDYAKFERAFLLLAGRGGVPAAALDAFMWYELQRLGTTVAALYGVGERRAASGPVRSTLAA